MLLTILLIILLCGIVGCHGNNRHGDGSLSVAHRLSLIVPLVPWRSAGFGGVSQ
jgi:hypothetical protein